MISKLSEVNHQKLRNLFIRYFRLEPEIQVEDIDQEFLPEWTSARHLGLIMEIEAEFGIRFVIDEVTKMVSFQDITYYFQGKI